MPPPPSGMPSNPRSAREHQTTPVRVLVVDDSAFFRRRISEVLSQDPGIQVIGTAANGSEAVDRVLKERPHVVTMDVEMPVMDGISAVRAIMSRCPTPVLMFSSLTRDGARATLDALEAGAMDFMPKRFEDIAANRDEAVRQFCLRVRTLGQKRALRPRPAAASAPARQETAAPAASRLAKRGDFEIVAIGASTGGPVALQRVLTQLPRSFSVPLIVVQHMPANFTATFAERLNQACAIRVKEAEDGDVLRPGTAYIAPGGRQMLVKRKNVGACLLVADGPPEINYKPCVDLTFKSLAAAYPGKVLAVVMTGMGADGCEGARMLKQGGATIWAQDEASSVVYGMPQAVARAGLVDRVLGVDSIGANLGQSV